jgi:hypothetical protein
MVRNWLGERGFGVKRRVGGMDRKKENCVCATELGLLRG